MSITAVVLLGVFVVWELRHDDPIVDIRLLRNRNFATACFFMFTLGMVLFGTTVIIPQFLQTLLGYSAQQAGMSLSPGAFALMLMMPIAGRLVSKVDARYMMAAGFLATSLALFHMTSLSLGIDFRTAVMMRLFQVIGLAFVFIPNNTLAYAGIPRDKNNQVSGMINLAR
ncbi:MAG TPA: EmrB/QacA family drug resistance transporter, partial [Solibacterales bacterium]|nr:EmrB/QacA family drug resistance transporter [Bryobacterales bacterium]